MNSPKTVLVTVGTTLFDALSRAVDNDRLLDRLVSLGYGKVLMQIGKGLYEPKVGRRNGIYVEFFRYRSSLAADVKNADLIISHAGAGSIMEALHAGKPLIVVVNDLLMNNHQLELAAALSSRKYVVSSTPDSLLDAISEENLSALIPYPVPTESSLFLSVLLDEVQQLI